ncbi:zinc ribbon domain-containing protein [Cumulibacter manganitolerans]|uniref:zinc ribbon domain-containing protein n=1 Tax=Cumulibacter manganitolerans TaxID=1884992 RepID=UPI001885DA25|nr:C4-type zinc ribbon domain-containing protein [Cumulibacter manganitolerans]
MQIEPREQLRLLDLADVDKSLNRLRHERNAIPELKTIEDADRQLAATRGDVVEAQTAQNDLDREIQRLEADIDSVRSRIARNQQRLDSGAVSSAKDVASLEHEMQTLHRRQSTLEDQELELMGRAEELEAQLKEVGSARQAVEEIRAGALAERDQKWAESDQTISMTQTQRDAMAATFDSELLALYDKIRATGVPGAALMTQRRCGGCRIELAGSELAAVRAAAPEEIVRCESCRCIMVRTHESGL